MHLAVLSAAWAWPRMFPVSPLTADTMFSVVSMLLLIAATSPLIRLATSRMAAAWALIVFAVPLIVPAVALIVAPVPLIVLAVPRIDPACPSIDWASWMMWSSWPW